MMNTFKILTNLGRIQKFLKISTVHTITLIFNCLAVLLYLHNVPPVPLSTLLKNPFSQESDLPTCDSYRVQFDQRFDYLIKTGFHIVFIFHRALKKKNSAVIKGAHMSFWNITWLKC